MTETYTTRANMAIEKIAMFSIKKTEQQPSLLWEIFINGFKVLFWVTTFVIYLVSAMSALILPAFFADTQHNPWIYTIYISYPWIAAAIGVVIKRVTRR